MSKRRRKGRGRSKKKDRKQNRTANIYNIRQMKRNSKPQKDIDKNKEKNEDKLKLELGKFNLDSKDFRYRIKDKEYEVSSLGWIILDSFWNTGTNSQKHIATTAHGQRVLKYVYDTIEVNR